MGDVDREPEVVEVDSVVLGDMAPGDLERSLRQARRVFISHTEEDALLSRLPGPDSPPADKLVMSLRLPVTMKSMIDTAAAEARMSASAWVRSLIENALRRPGGQLVALEDVIEAVRRLPPANAA